MKKHPYASRPIDYELMRCAVGSREHGTSCGAYTRRTATGRRVVKTLLGLFTFLAAAGAMFEFFQ